MTQRQFLAAATPWVRAQLEQIDRAGDTRVVQVQNRPIVVMTILGATSGKYRRVPVMRVERDGRYAVVASAGGQPRHPAWYHNLVAHPDIELQDGEESGPFRARLLSGAERAEWWALAVDAFPPYAEYQTKTDREIPVLLCEPARALSASRP